MKNSEEIFKVTQELLLSIDSELLSTLEKYGMNWLLNDPSLYLEKFGKHLPLDILENFLEISNDDYEVSHYLEKYLIDSGHSRKKQIHKNRRFAKLIRLLEESDYYSIESLMEREPDLVKAFLGRRFSAPFSVKSSLTEILLDTLEEKKETDSILVLDDLDIETNSSKPIGSIDSCMSNFGGSFGDFKGESVDNSVTLEKLKKELLTYCKERFMSGKDVRFQQNFIRHVFM